MKLTYEKNGDYLIPNLTANKEPEQALTKYGLMRKNFLKEHRRGILSGNDTDRGAESTLSAGTGAGRAENGTSDRTDGEGGGSERGTESSRSDELGSEDEQHQTLSGGNRTDRADLHLSREEQSNITMQEPDSDSNSLSGSFRINRRFHRASKGNLMF